MPVPTRITDFVAVAANNYPTGGETIGTSLDDYMRGIQAVVRGDLATKGADIAASATTDVGAVAGLYHDITGASTITSLGTTASAGIWKILQFDSTPVITHNTAIQLPGAANITAAAGDVATFMCEASNVFRCTSFIRAVSPPLDFATQVQQEAGASNVVAVTSGRQHFHPSAVKFYVKADVAGAIQGTSYNVTSLTDVSGGKIRVTIATDFSDANWVSHQGIQAQTALSPMVDNSAATPQAAGTADYINVNTSNTATDPTYWYISGIGDL
mgnify:CR=1 FL=1